jgi:hypothetical protein
MSNTEQQKHIEWKETESRIGPNTTYGYWDGAKVFSIYHEIGNRDKPSKTPYVIKSMLPGFRPDLPQQASIAEAQVFLERMLQRWVAKRGLLFKSHIVVTDAMVKAARDHYELQYAVQLGMSDDELRDIIDASLKARVPHAASNVNQKDSRNTIPTKRAPAKVR